MIIFGFAICVLVICTVFWVAVARWLLTEFSVLKSRLNALDEAHDHTHDLALQALKKSMVRKPDALKIGWRR